MVENDHAVELRTVGASDLAAFRRLHNRYVDRDASMATVQTWHDEHPDLLVGADVEGRLVGHALGRPQTDDAVALAGLSVVPERRREGLGSALLTAFEDRAASLGFERVTLGSAGGYVDRFYLANGYAPTSILVRLDIDAEPEGYRDRSPCIAEETVERGTRKVYLAVDGYDPAVLEDVRAAFDDPEAIYLMEKPLDGA